MRFPRDEAVKHLSANGFAYSRPAHAGEMWRNPKTRERTIVPNGSDMDERNFSRILRACGKTDDEVKETIDVLTPVLAAKQPTANGPTS